MTKAQFNKLNKLLGELDVIQSKLYQFPRTKKTYSDKIEDAAFSMNDTINKIQNILDSCIIDFMDC